MFGGKSFSSGGRDEHDSGEGQEQAKGVAQAEVIEGEMAEAEERRRVRKLMSVLVEQQGQCEELELAAEGSQHREEDLREEHVRERQSFAQNRTTKLAEAARINKLAPLSPMALK